MMGSPSTIASRGTLIPFVFLLIKSWGNNNWSGPWRGIRFYDVRDERYPGDLCGFLSGAVIAFGYTIALVETGEIKVEPEVRYYPQIFYFPAHPGFRFTIPHDRNTFCFSINS